MTGYVADVGTRLMGEQALPVQELGYVFTRTDRYTRMRNRNRVLPEDRRWLHLTLALERWIVKKARRQAEWTGAGLAYCKPQIEYQRNPSLRAWEVAVWMDWAAIPDRKGETLRVPTGVSKDWQVL